jgi:hypothetical protein
MTTDHNALGQVRTFVWAGVADWRAETATVRLTSSGLTARGTQLGATPFPYRMEYELDARHNWVTEQLSVTIETPSSRRSIQLTHDGRGTWKCEATMDGHAGLPPPGGRASDVDGAIDCDLGFSPLTNLMPIRRHSLNTHAGGHDFVMAWVSVPDLRLIRAEQRYEHVTSDGKQSVVRYVGKHRGFTGQLTLDADGFVVAYPEMARLVAST